MEVDSNRPNPLVTSVLLTWSADVAILCHIIGGFRNGLAEGCESPLGLLLEAFLRKQNSPGKENKWEVQT